jgi:hypothetical protein
LEELRHSKITPVLPPAPTALLKTALLRSTPW